MKSHSFITETPSTKTDTGLEPDGSNAVSKGQIPSGKKARRPYPEQKNFACPFWKSDQLEHIKCGSMLFPAISYVKQHLARVHRPPFSCQRCHRVFESHQQLESHFLEICKVEPAPKTGFLTAEQVARLQRRSSPTVTLEQQWFQIYDIVFPGRPRPISPYDDKTAWVLSLYDDFVFSEGPKIFQDVLSSHRVGDPSIDSILQDALLHVNTRFLSTLDKIPDNGNPGESAIRPSTVSGWSGTTLVPTDAPSPLDQSDFDGT